MDRTAQISTPLTTAGHVRATLALGLPLVGSNLAQMALHVTDTVMMGWYGVTELAALVLGSSSFFIVFILGAGFSQAVMPMVAAALGRGDEAQVRRDTRMGMWLSIAFGVLCFPLFWWSEPLFLALGQQPDVARLAAEFMAIAGLGMIPALLVRVMTSYLAALERTQVLLWITLAAVAVNAALAWALIFGHWGAPELGVRGAAIASVGTQIATFLSLAAYAALHPALRRFRLFQRFWRPDLPGLRGVFRLGWPIGLTSVAEGGLFQASALMMGVIGTVELAAHGIAMQCASITFMVHVGLSSAATVRAGRAVGLRDGRALRDGARVAIAISAAFSLLTVALFLAFPTQIISVFLDMSQPETARILTFGAVLLAMAALFQVADAMQVMALGLLRGVQDTRVPMLLAAVSYWVIGIPASWVLAFPLGFGGVGLWTGLVIGLAVAAVLLMLRFWTRAPRPVTQAA
ncbi:MAG: MATE family efflux transporter [Gemmobacter sp.]